MGLYPLGYHYGVMLSCQLYEQLVSVDVSDSFSSILICKISSAWPATHHQPELINLMVDLSFSSPVFIHVVIVLINDFVITFIHRLLLVCRGPEEHSVINCFIHIYARLMGGSASIHTKMKYQCYHVRQNKRINLMAN